MHDVFDPPPRQYAVGAAYLRAQGSGRTIRAVHGLDRVSERTRSLVVESKAPRARPAGRRRPTRATATSSSAIPTPRTVEQALAELITTIRVETG